MATKTAPSTGWRKLPDAPKEGEEILYVVEGRNCAPYVKKGERNYVVNEGWWWCDSDAIFSEEGNDGDDSFVRYWMPVPKPPRIHWKRKQK